MRKASIVVSSSILLALFAGCSRSNTETIDSRTNSNSVAAKVTETIVQQKPELWIPESVEKCIGTVSVVEKIEPDASINPYYLRVDFDCNSILDHAVDIQGTASKKRGVILCRDNSAGSVHGPIAGSKSIESEKLDTNYITENWEAASASEARNPFIEPGKKVKTTAKGEAIAFVFEGGAVIYLYWDGQRFRLFDGV